MNKVVLIGLDGATYTILNHLMDTGVMPHLKEWLSEGVHGELMSTPIPLTPPAWTSMITGSNPGSHGLFDFLVPQETKTGFTLKLNDSKDIKRETIWSIVSRQNRRVATLNFFGMSPASPVNGYMISGFIPWKHLRRATYPNKFYDTVKSLPGVDIKSMGFDLEQEKKCLQGKTMSTEESLEWINSHIKREKNWFTVLKHIMENDPCDLTAIVFDGVDKIQHLFWPYLMPGLLPEQLNPEQQSIKDVCIKYFRQLDGIISEIVNLAGDDAKIFMTSDHGFGTTNEIFYLNKWLHDQGYLQWIDSTKMAQNDQLTEGRMSSHIGLIDHNKTTAYAWTPSSNGIYIRVSDDPEKPGIKPQEYDAFREKIRKDLLSFRCPVTNRQVIRKVLTREEAFPGKYTNNAPDLMVLLHDYSIISILNTEAPLKSRSEPAGCHNPEGIFLARGSDIKKGERIEQKQIVDIAPTLLYSMGLPVPEDFEGILVSEVFEDDFIKKHEYKIGEKTKPVNDDSAKQESDMPETDKKGIMRQLQMLGYME